MLQAAESIVLAAAMLCGGTSNQQKEAEAFVTAELAKHDKGVSDRLIEKLKGTVKMDEDGVWVSVMSVCRKMKSWRKGKVD